MIPQKQTTQNNNATITQRQEKGVKQLTTCGYSEQSHLEPTSTLDFFVGGEGSRFGCSNPLICHTCIPKAHKDSPSGAISPASPAHLTCAGKCREPASDERAPGPGSRASTSRWWPRLPGPPDVSEGRRPRSVPRAGHAGPRPGLSFRKRWQPGWPTWKGRKVMSHDLSPSGRPARPAGAPRPPEARAGEHRPTRSALHPAGARPGRLCSPGTPRPA